MLFGLGQGQKVGQGQKLGQCQKLRQGQKLGQGRKIDSQTTLVKLGCKIPPGYQGRV